MTQLDQESENHLILSLRRNNTAFFISNHFLPKNLLLTKIVKTQ